jgi:diacylglycerol O-acyltransferase / wax synthase
VVDATDFSLADCKAIREHAADVTINDIFLATCGGAVRRYLAAKHELPEQSLSALMPISTRSEKSHDAAGNQLAMVPVPLRSDIADPIERLRRVHRGARGSQGASSMLGHDFAAKLIQVIPSLAAESLVTHGLVPMCNTTVSNVRGPDVPLYMAGARLQVYLPVSIPFNGIGLNMTGFSYNGVLWVCFVSCRDMLQDPSFFSQCLKESFDEILEAAKKLPRVAGEATKVTASKATPKTRSTAKPASKTIAKPAAKAAVSAAVKTGRKAAGEPPARRTKKPVEASKIEGASLASEISAT